MSLRAWTFSDLDEIAAIEEECFTAPWTRRMLAESFLSDRFHGVLLEEEGSVVAYGGMSIVLDEAEIQLVAVSEMYRRCGRGSRIMEELLRLAAARGVKKVFLLFRSVGCKNVTLNLYPGGRHEMLNEINRAEVREDLLDWLEAEVLPC